MSMNWHDRKVMFESLVGDERLKVLAAAALWMIKGGTVTHSRSDHEIAQKWEEVKKELRNVGESDLDMVVEAIRQAESPFYGLFDSAVFHIFREQAKAA